MRDSQTGVETQSDMPTLEERLLEMGKRNAARAREREQQTSSAPPLSMQRAGKAQIASGLRQGGVPEVYLDAKWSQVRSPAVWAWAQTVYERTHRRSDGTPRDGRLAGRGLILLGPVGTGKSSAAALACTDAVSRGRNVLWQYVPDLIDELTQKSAQRAAVVNRAARADLLVWDDFGVRDMADWELGYLDQIVERRYREFRPMIVTSNLLVEDLVTDTRLGRITDRWRERTASERVVLSGESMRGATSA